MSAKSDIFKALKEGGYKIASTGRHILFRNALGYEVRVHNGNNLSGGLVRNILQQIRSGSSRTGRHN